MFTSNIIGACLEGRIISDNMKGHREEFNNFRLLDEDDARLVKGSLHIGNARSLYTATRGEWDREYIYTVIITGGENVLDFFTESPGFHIICTDLPRSRVVNNLSALADRFSRMYSLKRHLHSSVYVADPILQGAAEAMEADVFYLTARLRVLGFSRTLNCPDFAELNTNDHLKLSDATRLRDEWTVSGDWAMRLVPLDYEDRVSAYLLVVTRNDAGQLFNTELLEQLRMSMERFLEISFSDRSVADSRFTTMAIDLLDGKIKDREELEERLHRNMYTFTSHFVLIVLEAQNLNERVDPEIIPVLTSMYPGSFPLQYDNKIALMVQLEHYTSNPDIKQNALRALLEEYHLYACYSSVTRNLLSLRTTYSKTAKCLLMARTFAKDRSKRLFADEDFAMFAVIDTAYNAVKDEYHGDYIKLCSPAAIALNYYDKKHGTNNSEVLKRYLLNGCNMSRTAEDLGMHRNTLMYRMDRIREICGKEFSDQVTNFRMLFSLMAIDYMAIYRKRATLYTPASDMDQAK